MKKKIILSLTAVLLLCSVMAQPADNAPLKLRVSTYNVGHFNQGMKGGLEIRGKNYYPDRKEVTEKYILKEILGWKKWIGEQSPDFFACRNGTGTSTRTALL